MTTPKLFDPFQHLNVLLADFGLAVVEARRLVTPNVEDDEFIRCGMIGFARHLSLDNWDHNHFRYVAALRDEVANGHFSIPWQRFTALAAGYFLGMRVAGQITDLELRHAEMLTPGFMWLHAGAFDPS